MHHDLLSVESSLGYQNIFCVFSCLGLVDINADETRCIASPQQPTERDTGRCGRARDSPLLLALFEIAEQVSRRICSSTWPQQPSMADVLALLTLNQCRNSTIPSQRFSSVTQAVSTAILFKLSNFPRRPTRDITTRPVRRLVTPRR